MTWIVNVAYKAVTNHPSRVFTASTLQTAEAQLGAVGKPPLGDIETIHIYLATE